MDIIDERFRQEFRTGISKRLLARGVYLLEAAMWIGNDHQVGGCLDEF
jgi:hypothetical protein